MPGPPEGNLGPDFMMVRSDWKAMGELEDLAAVEDELEPFDAAEDDWRDLGVGEEGGEEPSALSSSRDAS